MHRNVLIACVGALAAAILGLGIADYARPWRSLQTEFIELQRQQLRSRLEALESRDAGTLKALQADIAAEEARLAGRRDETTQLADSLRQFRGKRQTAELRRDKVRSELEMARWQLERSPDAVGTEELAALQEELRQSRMEVESLGEFIAERESKSAAAHAELDNAQQQWQTAREPLEAVEQQLAELGSPRPFDSLLSPRVHIRQVTVADFPQLGGNTPQSERVDRCVTCHLGMSSEAVLTVDPSEVDPGEVLPDEAHPDEVPAVFHHHPRQGLFLSSDSPHPYGRFGCTVCHGGQGRATDFSRAGHTPRTVDQEATWSSTWGWQSTDQLETMLPLHLTEASCSRCHAATRVDATTLAAGQQLITTLGCTGCHSADHTPLDKLPKTGPSLLSIDGKTRPAWAVQWLESPRDFRPSTAMPHNFDTPADEPSAEARRLAERVAVVQYLWEHSRSAVYEPSADGAGDSGRMLFRSLGCAVCHLVEPEPPSQAEPHDVAATRRAGPNLARIGSKVTAGWLQAWLLDPQAVQPGTTMPSLRLDETEAADLVAYLMTRRDSRWEETTLPTVDVDVRDALVLAHLEQDHTLEASQSRLDQMTDRDKGNYLGKQTIAARGCHRCHEIPGFDSAEPLGPSLSELGHRLHDASASGTRYLWATDSHRPGYRLSAAETEAITVAILGAAGPPFDPTSRADTERTATLESGRRIIERYGCRGCHRIEGKGGMSAEAVASDQAPPDLRHVGARLRSPWLFSYLMDPGSVSLRPWLTTRMPSFSLTEAEGNDLVRYFTALDDRQILAQQAVPSRASAGQATDNSSSAADLAVGRVVFNMLQCDGCHRGGSKDGFLSLPEVAPPYELAQQRLRPEWVVDWILDPQQWHPDTLMPATFLADGESEPDSSFLIGSINTPIFNVERQRLRRLFDTEEDLEHYLADPERVARALKAYLWTLGD